MHTITFTRDNFVGQDNNRLVYNLPGSSSLEGAEVALSTLYMYYSWQNINDTSLANNVFTITLPDLTQDGTGAPLPSTASGVVLTVTIPPGLYEIADINAYLQQFCINNNFYLVNSTTGEYVYFLQFQTNTTLYKVQLNMFALPDIPIAAGFTAPTGGFLNCPPVVAAVGAAIPNGAFPATGSEIVGVNLAASNFSTIVGAPGNVTGSTLAVSSNISTWPPSTVASGVFPNGNAVWLSNVAPAVQPNSVIYLNLAQIANQYSNPQTVLYPIAAKTAIGELLIIEPPEYAWNKLTPGTISQFILTFTDRNGAPIKILDPDVVITLVVKDQVGEHANIGPDATALGGTHARNSQMYQRHPANTSGPRPTMKGAVVRRLTDKSNS